MSCNYNELKLLSYLIVLSFFLFGLLYLNKPRIIDIFMQKKMFSIWREQKYFIFNMYNVFLCIVLYTQRYSFIIDLEMLGDKSKKTKLINHIVSHTFPTESRTINLNYTYIYIYIQYMLKGRIRELWGSLES